MANLEAAAQASTEHLGHGADDNWLLAMSLSHVGGMSIVVRQAYVGGCITRLDRFDPKAAAEAIRRDVTMVSVVPTMLRRLIPLGHFHGVRAVLVGGGPIPPGLLEQAVRVGLPVLPTYGMTETFGQVATLRPGAPLTYGGHPLPGVEIEIRGGRIAIRGPMVSTDVVDADGWYVTNDLGVMEGGVLKVMGRADNVIVTGGVNVDPEKVEAVIAPFVQDVVVLGVPDDEWGQAVVCLYVGANADLAAVTQEILTGPDRPKRFIEVEAIPKTELGKPDRRAALALV